MKKIENNLQNPEKKKHVHNTMTNETKWVSMSGIQLLQWPGFSKIFIYFSCFLILFQDFSKLIIDIVLYLVRHISNIKKKKIKGYTS